MATLAQAKIAKQVLANRYLGKPNGINIVGVGVGNKYMEGVDTREVCVRVYVSRKLEPGLLAPAYLIPDQFLGVPTDVVEVGHSFAPRAKVKLSKTAAPRKGIGPGSSIGPAPGNGASNFNGLVTGTLGAVLKSVLHNGQDGPKYILSCNHILSVKGRIHEGDPIVSPGPDDASDGGQVAKLTSSIPLNRNEANLFDCAIAEISDTGTTKLDFPELPVAIGGPAALPKEGLAYKYGKTTGATNGRIVDTAADILVEYSFGTYRFENQVLIDGGKDYPFAADGDSGAVVFSVPESDGHTPADKPFPVAIVIAPVGRLTAACPLAPALAVLEQTLNVKKLSVMYPAEAAGMQQVAID